MLRHNDSGVLEGQGQPVGSVEQIKRALVEVINKRAGLGVCNGLALDGGESGRIKGFVVGGAFEVKHR